MAATTAGGLLTEAHRAAQTRIATSTALRLVDSWQLLDLTNLDATSRLWLDTAVPIVESGAKESAKLASTYYEQFRRLELGANTTFSPVVADTVNTKAIETSLRVTGPVDLKRQMAYRLLKEAGDTARLRMVGAGIRHTLDAGRATIRDNVDLDNQATGLARVTASDPCWFCAMLASRGPVYKDTSFNKSDPRFAGGGDQKVHDHCRCSLEPAFKQGVWPSRARGYAELWDRTSRMDGDALINFRRAYENR